MKLFLCNILCFISYIAVESKLNIELSKTINKCSDFDESNEAQKIINGENAAIVLSGFGNDQRQKIVENIGIKQIKSSFKGDSILYDCLAENIADATVRLLYRTLHDENKVEAAVFGMKLFAVFKHYPWLNLESRYNKMSRTLLIDDLKNIYDAENIDGLYPHLFKSKKDQWSVTNLTKAIKNNNPGRVLRIFLSTDSDELKSLIEQYDQYSGSKMSDYVQKVKFPYNPFFQYLVKDAYDRHSMYASWIKDWITTGQNDKVCTILVSRSELDMGIIISKYDNIAQQSLTDAINNNFEGVRKQVFLNFVEGNDC